MKKIKVFLSLFLSLVSVVALAQNVTVKGQILDESTGEPVPYATVQEKGTTNGVASGVDGTYTFTVPANATLVFSSIGYANTEIAVNGKAVINASLKTDSQYLEDVVIVAYGTAKKEAVTGSVSSIAGEKLTSAPVTSVDKALQGKLAGVQITTNTGQPGASSQIRVRGTSSINASNAPLWVVDGIPVVSGDNSLVTNTANAIAVINPNDIESITVLKDAAAAAAYGSRAANGVILVTTKSGREGQAQFDVRAKYGVSWLQSDSGFRMMNPAELLGYQRDAVINAGMNPDDPTCAYYRPVSLLDKTYNWLNEMLHVGRMQEYEVSARAGTAKSKFYSSLSYHKNEGIANGIDYQKFQARINADHKLLKRLDMGVRANFGFTDQRDVPMGSLYYSNPVWAGETMLPWYSPYNEDGTPNVNLPTNMYTNPLATAMYDQKWDRNFRILAMMYLRYEPIDGLVIETKNSAEGMFGQARSYWSPLSDGTPGGADATLQTERNQDIRYTTSNTVTYSNTFGTSHNFRAVVGQEAMSDRYDLEYVLGDKVDPNIPYVNTATQENQAAEVSFSNETLLSFFGIFDYNYDNRYFLQANVRADGSSLFGSNNKWGVFWSASASWNLSNEKFLKNVKAINLLKLRASYGLNGNNGIGAYQAYGIYGAAKYNGYTGYLPSQPNNDILSWEKNSTWNVGIDFGFFDRLTGSIDVYSRKTLDMLLDKQTPYTTGFGSIFMNTGSMKNTGVEVQLDVDIINNNDFFWSLGGNFAYNKNEILDLGGEEYIENGSFVRHVVGKSMYTYIAPLYYGVNPSNGEALWIADYAEDGSPILTNNYNNAKVDYCGSPDPKFIGGFNTTFSWKGLSLSAFFEYKAGADVMILNEGRYLCSDGAQMTMNQKASALNYWKQPGDTNCNPKPIAGNSTHSADALSSRWVEKGDFLRIKDVTLSYSLSKKVLQKTILKGVRFYVSGLNLYCFNDVDMWDPELGTSGTGAGVYPLTKSFIGGVEISF